MNENDIRVVQLDPIRVASAYAFGESPETAALAKMQQFAEESGLLEKGVMPPTFGFNNPSPGAGSPNYGYEVWLPVADSIEPTGDMRIIDYPGGLYAVATCHGLQNIGSDWLALAKWREGTEYAAGKQQWLEYLLSSPEAPPEQFHADLYLPIAE